MYKIINEDNSLVMEQASKFIFNLMNEDGKEFIFLFKKEMDKLTEKEGLGKITVSLTYDSDIIEKVFSIKNTKKLRFEEREEIIDKIMNHMINFCKVNNLIEYYNFVYIVSD